MIKKVGSMWYLYNKTGTKVLGKFKTKKEAIQREQEILYFSQFKKKK